ncbi:hypothetical protein LC085_19730 [Bacillus tianshenii]|uniref:hypothetical protein n=1 Tax=Sutcliffiella tianshenii TaxID=1463404 RepID=UPI001CD487B5|nr:hypothetical protein [Bacillus tianshenii]MCA1322118.1 hypothetical protein [Bacillus tianshenii]
MGHDISGFNKAKEEVAYARFSKCNYNAITLYNLLDANDYYAGVSGSGGHSMFSVPQIEKAIVDYDQLLARIDSKIKDESWDLKQISEFLQNCLATAKKEGSVGVYFG